MFTDGRTNLVEVAPVKKVVSSVIGRVCNFPLNSPGYWSVGWMVGGLFGLSLFPKRLHFYCSYRSTYLIVFFLICFTDNFRCFKQTRNKAFNHFGTQKLSFLAYFGYFRNNSPIFPFFRCFCLCRVKTETRS